MCPRHRGRRRADVPGTSIPRNARQDGGRARFSALARPLLSPVIMKSFAPSLLLVLVAAPGLASAQAAPTWKSAEPPPTATDADCQEAPTEDPALNTALRALVFQQAGQAAAGEPAFSGVRFAGLTTLQEPALWEVLGG